MAKREINQVRVGAILSYVSMFLSTAISLVYTPIMIQRLGESEFGVYQSVLPIVSYLNLLSLGMGSAYVRYYSRAKVKNDQRMMAKLNGMFLLTFSVLGAICLLIGFTLSFHGDVIFGKNVTPEEIALGEKLLRILTVNAAIFLVTNVFNAHITLHERYLFQKVMLMLKQVLNPLLMIPLLILGFRSVTLTLVTLTFTVITILADMYYCLVKLKMRFSFRHYDFSLMRRMFGFTAYVFIGIVVDNFNWSIDRLLLLWLHGTTAVTVYTVAAQLNIFYQAFSTAVSNVLTPRIHRLVAERRPMREMDALFIKTGRLQFIILGCIFLGFVAVGRTFVVQWGGDQMFAVDYYTTLLLFFATIWPNVQIMGYEILRAKNMHKFSALVYAAVAIFNAIISIPLCLWWEGLGAALGTMISTFLGNVLIINWYYRRCVGLNIPRFWKRIFQLLPSMAVPLLAALAIAIWAPVHGYLGVVLWGAVFMAVYAFFLWFFGMNRFERGLVSGPVNKILRRFRR